MKSVVALSTTVALLSGTADAFWRMECTSRSGLARLDPLVYPGQIATHSHAIHGGSGFSKDADYKKLRDSKCSSCLVKEDKSAYWTPAMNFMHANGTTQIVPQMGGMLAYYLLLGDNLKAFPEGFQMLAGDTRLRNFTGVVPDPPTSAWGKDDLTEHALGQKSIGMNCLDYFSGRPNEASRGRHFLPDKDYLETNCKNGIRAEIFFPSCWDGKNADTDNHRDHMRYPTLIDGGKCPEGFETRVPSLFFETIWATEVFKGLPGYFTFSNGDPTGYGYHGDFMNGWDKTFLQGAIDTCTNPSGNLKDCGVFQPHMQSMEEAAKCKFEVPEELKDDNCDGPADQLCGKVPVQLGPEYASSLIPGDGEKPDPTPAPPAVTEQPLVPSASFEKAETVVTDKFGGGLSHANAEMSIAKDIEIAAATPTPTPEPVVAEAVAEVKDVAAEAAAPSASSSSQAVAPAAPAPTPAPPAGEAPPADAGKILSTKTYTQDGVVHVEVIQQQIVTVIENVVAPQRRHAHHRHQHLRRDREHGLLGRQ
ncbi:hypothetical protein BDV95DRAFT_612332 [Massariosphaeria phaeospora]|uniref:DUF1996 domain-containing protein n=1 Tax=Massariosphaeria phaeospora TaxID=100035 RepID=A0A7C8HZ32_9PLEO|nr:hypothetical protein BDV95DRAFT_612332 [Massariosphaeria phaeospora]